MSRDPHELEAARLIRAFRKCLFLHHLRPDPNDPAWKTRAREKKTLREVDAWLAEEQRRHEEARAESEETP